LTANLDVLSHTAAIMARCRQGRWGYGSNRGEADLVALYLRDETAVNEAVMTLVLPSPLSFFGQFDLLVNLIPNALDLINRADNGHRPRRLLPSVP
jgi:hypothetical protein